MTNTINRIIFACTLLVFAACNNEEQNANPDVKNGIVPISYSRTGTGDTALVFVHGWGINKEYWNDQVKAFDKRFTVVTVDLGGHGKSGTQRDHYNVDDFANDVMAVMDSLNLNKVILVGHSMGGDIILNIAFKIPDRIVGLIGVDNFKEVGVPLSPEQNMQMKEFMQELSVNYKETARAFCKMNLFPPNYADSSSVNRVLTDVVNTDSVVATKALKGIFEFQPNEVALLKEIPKPMHLIVSDYTPILQDSLAKYSKAGYGVKTIHGTGHYPMIEKPEEFNKLLDETLNEIAAGK